MKNGLNVLGVRFVYEESTDMEIIIFSRTSRVITTTKRHESIHHLPEWLWI